MASKQIFSANPEYFEEEDIIGCGKCGIVYKVKDEAGNEYAVKKIDISKLPNRDLASAEVAALKSLEKIDHVVRLYDHFKSGDVLRIAMELCTEGSLKDALDEKIEKKKWFEEETLVHWFAQLVNVLNYCHVNNILHRDIKPENILLVCDRQTVKLADFGIAKMFKGTEGPLNTTTFVGTLAYLPPEMFISGRYDAKTDVWGLGMTLYHLMAKQLPLSESLPEFMKELKSS